MLDQFRMVMTAPGIMLFTCTPSLIPCSAKALPEAMMAAFVAATAAKAGFGSSAALPDIKTTEPLLRLSASQARESELASTVQLQFHPCVPLIVGHLEGVI